MSLAGQVSALASRVATEFKSVRTSIATLTGTLNGKEPTITAGTVVQYWRGDKIWAALDKAAVGLSLVNNTADTAKPVSTAQQTALDLKLSIADRDYAVAKATNATNVDHTTVGWQQVTFSPTLAYGTGQPGVSYASNVFTIQRAGHYFLTGGLVFAAISSTNPRRALQIEIVPSGQSPALGFGTVVARAETTMPTTGTVLPTFSLAGEVVVAVGDVVRLVAYQNSTVTVAISNTTAPSYLSMRFLG